VNLKVILSKNGGADIGGRTKVSVFPVLTVLQGEFDKRPCLQRYFKFSNL